MKKMWRRLIALVGILAVLLIAGSCKQKVDTGSSTGLSKDTSLKMLKVGDKDLLSNLGNGSSISINKASSVTNVVLKVEANHKKAKLSIKKGDKVISPATDNSYNISLALGNNKVSIIITAEDGKTQNIIEVNIIRMSFLASNLKALKFMNEDVLASLDAANSYDAGIVLNPRKTGALIVTRSSEKVAVSVKNGETKINPDASEPSKYIIPLKEGNNTITVEVTAADGKTKDKVIIKVKRNTVAEDIDTDLKEFKHKEDDLDLNLSEYKLGAVFNSVTETYFIIKTKNPDAKVTVKKGSVSIVEDTSIANKYIVSLNEGANNITVKITSQDGSKSIEKKLSIYRCLPGEEKDISLVFVKVESSEISLKTLKTNVASGSTSIALEVQATSSAAKVAIEEAVTDSHSANATKNITLTGETTEVIVNVKSVNGDTKGYKVTIIKDKENLLLSSLDLTVGSNPVNFIFNPADSNIDAIVPTISGSNILKIKATAFVSGATIKIGDNAATTNVAEATYNVLKPSIDIVVKKGTYTKTYTLHLAVMQPKTSVKVNLMSFVGGSNVVGTEIKVYKANTNVEATTAVATDASGNATFNLDSNAYYDFVAVPANGRAESKVLNVFVAGGLAQDLVMIQRIANIGYKTEAPIFEEINYAKFDVGTNSILPDGALVNGYELNASSVQIEKGGILVKFKCPSGAIGNLNGDDGNFGVAFNIGTSASALTNSGLGLQASAITTATDGSKICEYFIPLFKTGFPDGNNILYIVAYDVAGNRVEKQIPIKFVGTLNSAPITGATIERFYVNIQRLPKPLNTYGNEEIITPYGLDQHNGMETTYNSLFTFWVKDKNGEDLAINGYDLYRRKYESSANVNDNWELVGKKVYDGPSTGFQSANSDYRHLIGRHWGNDADNKLEENTQYQYKVVAFTDAFNRVESPIATTAVLPAFLTVQNLPAENEVIKQADLGNTEFSFTLTNSKLWDNSVTFTNAVSDFFIFGLLVVDKSSNNEVVYCAKIKYHLYKTGDERLEIENWSKAKGNHFMSLAEWKGLDGFPQDVTPETFLGFNTSTGVVTIKKEFLAIGDFNTWDFSPLSEALEVNHSYFWDIQDFGGDPSDWSDDLAPSFVKEWAVLDSKTGAVIPGYELSRARAGSNIGGNQNAITGRRPFSVSE